MPRIVDEGRRIINNIQRSAALFLIKNIFSFTISLVLLLVAMPYPFVPFRSLSSAFFVIGLRLLLTFEPCYEKVHGRFLRTVLLRALPGGLTCATCILAAMAASAWLNLTTEQLSSLCTLVIAYAGLLALGTVCRPFTPLRATVLGLMCAGYSLAIVLFGPWTGLVPLPAAALGILAGLFALASLSVLAAVPFVYLVHQTAAALPRISENRFGKSRSGFLYASLFCMLSILYKLNCSLPKRFPFHRQPIMLTQINFLRADIVGVHQIHHIVVHHVQIRIVHPISCQRFHTVRRMAQPAAHDHNSWKRSPFHEDEAHRIPPESPAHPRPPDTNDPCPRSIPYIPAGTDDLPDTESSFPVCFPIGQAHHQYPRRKKAQHPQRNAFLSLLCSNRSTARQTQRPPAQARIPPGEGSARAATGRIPCSHKEFPWPQNAQLVLFRP